MMIAHLFDPRKRHPVKTADADFTKQALGNFGGGRIEVAKESSRCEREARFRALEGAAAGGDHGR